MFLHEAFPPELIKIGLEAEDKDEAFEELVDLFCQTGKSNARKEILEALRQREAKMSTGIRKGIALPHARTDALDKIHGVLGISKKGLEYDALDGKPVYLIFMVFAPLANSETYLRLLKRLAEIMGNPQFYAEILAQNDSRSVNAIIKRYENIYTASEYN